MWLSADQLCSLKQWLLYQISFLGKISKQWSNKSGMLKYLSIQQVFGETEGCSWSQYPRNTEHVVSHCAVTHLMFCCLQIFFFPILRFFSGLRSYFLRCKHVHWAGQHSGVAFSTWTLSVLVWPVRICTDRFALTGCSADWFCHRLIVFGRLGGFGQASWSKEWPISEHNLSSSSLSPWLKLVVSQVVDRV